MLITNKVELIKYSTPYRLWQGIPGIEVTKKGRIFATFYSGGTRESIGNFTVLVKSDDGEHFSEPIAALYKEDHRCYDPCIWIDPLDRLWFMWGYAPEHAVYAVICDDPDADELVWSEKIKIGKDVMMNKPTVLSTGEWLFPIAVWKQGVRAIESEYDSVDDERKAFVYRSCDEGKTFERVSGVDIEDRDFDEHMILELKDGTLAMFIRTKYGIGVAYSYDRGNSWTEGEKSDIAGPTSRFHIRRLKSGRILLINHYEFEGRNNLTALLSEDEGKTWKYKLLLDERNDIAYPDAKESEDGYIYITYDRERGDFLNSIEQVYGSAREILMAKITEQDIIDGKVNDPGSKLKCIISKLGKYAYEDDNVLNELKIYTNDEIDVAKHYFVKSANDIEDDFNNKFGDKIQKLCGNEKENFDKLMTALKNKQGTKEVNICEALRIINPLV